MPLLGMQSNANKETMDNMYQKIEKKVDALWFDCICTYIYYIYVCVRIFPFYCKYMLCSEGDGLEYCDWESEYSNRQFYYVL